MEKTNKYVSFKDKEIYKNIKYTTIHRLLYKTDTHIATELELLDKDSNWHLNCPFEHEFKAADENNDKEFLSFWGKYRKWQKRKKYTIEEFEKLFDPLN